MELFSRRPAALSAAVALIIALIYAYLNFVGRILLIIGILILFSVSVVYFKRRPEKKIAMISGLSFSLFAFSMTALLIMSSVALYDFNVGRGEKYSNEGTEHLVKAVIFGVKNQTDWYASYEVSLESTDGKASFDRGLLICEGAYGYGIGDEISCYVNFVSLDEIYADYGTDRYDLISKGIHFACEPTKEITLLGNKITIRTLLSEFRLKLGASISIFCEHESAALVKALLLSDRDDIGLLRRDMSRLGVSHLLALSGLHLSIICGMIEFVTKRLKFSKLARVSCQIIGAFVFLAISGFPYSLLRASLMLLLLNFARITGHDRDSVTILFLTGWIIALFDPSALIDIGFELSFFATLGVVLTLNDETHIRRKLRKFTKKHISVALVRDFVFSILMSPGALLFVIPLQWIHFGELSLMSVFATLMFTPLFTVLLWIAVPYAAAAYFNLSVIASFLAGLIKPIVDLISNTASEMSKFRVCVSLNYKFVPIFILLFVAAIMLTERFSTYGQIKLIGLFAVFFVGYIGTVGIYENIRAESNELYFVNSKTNDSAVVYSGGKCLVVDISSGSSLVMNRTVEKMKQNCITEVDTFMFTHLHRSHAVMFTKLCQNMLVHRVLIPTPESEYEKAAAYAIEYAACKAGTEVEYYSRFDYAIDYENVEITLKDFGKLKRSTHELIAIDFCLGEKSIFYSGASVWEKDIDFTADAVVIGTHGPKIKSDPIFDIPEVFYSDDAYFKVGIADNT